MAGVFLAWGGLTLVREPYAAKGHEITTIPHLLRPHSPGGVVTLDIAGCRTAIVQPLRDAAANYVWPSSTTSPPSTKH